MTSDNQKREFRFPAVLTSLGNDGFGVNEIGISIDSLRLTTRRDSEQDLLSDRAVLDISRTMTYHLRYLMAAEASAFLGHDWRPPVCEREPKMTTAPEPLPTASGAAWQTERVAVDQTGEAE